MSRLDDIENRLTALELGGALAKRLVAIEATLGMAPAPDNPDQKDVTMCPRCGMGKVLGDMFRCSQTHCPLK